MKKVFVTCLAVALIATVSAVASPVEKIAQDTPGGDSTQVGAASPAQSQYLQTFETTPPSGWTVTDLCGDGVIWATAAFWGMTNNTTGSGECASCDSDSAGSGTCLDTELISPDFDFCNATNSGMNVALYYENYAALDFFDIDVSVDKGATWANLLSWNSDMGTTDVSLTLDTYDGEPSVRFRFHYYCPGCGWVWYAQVDNFELTADGSIVEGQGDCGGPTDGGTVTPATNTTGVIILGVLLMIGGSLFLVLRRRTA
jgi:hypothetical protein